jgi:hypothetical protein
MATYNYNGQTFSAPDDMPAEKVMSLLQGTQGAQPQVASQGSAEPQTKVEEDSLQYNKDWVGASRVLWNMNNPPPKQGEAGPSDAELATYGAKQMDWFNGNSGALFLDAARLHQASDEQKKAFVHLMDTYPNVKWSMRSAGTTALALATDPLNWVGLASFGLGTTATQTAKAISKEGLKQALKAGVVAGIENATVSAASNVAEQGIRVDAGQQEGIEAGQVAKAAALGGAAGVVLGSTVHEAGAVVKEKVNQWREAPKLIDEPNAPAATTGAGEAPPATPDAPKAETPVSEAPKGAEEAPPVEPTVTQGEAPTEAPKAPEGEAPKVEGEAAPEGEQMELPLGDTPTPRPEATTVTADLSAHPNPIIRALDHVVRNDGFRAFPTAKGKMSEDVQEALRVVDQTPPDQLKAAVEEARAAYVPPEVRHALDTTFRDATEALFRRVAELEKAKDTAGRDRALEQLEAVRPADLKYSSGDGAALGARGGNINTGEFRDVDENAILRKKGIDPGLAKPEQIAKARDEFSKQIQNRVEALDRDREIQRLKTVQDEAVRSGDTKSAIKAGMERQAVMAAKVAAEVDPAKRAIGQAALRAQRIAVELMISNVFSPKTLVMNIIPTAIKMAIRPGVDAIVKGADRAAWRQASIMYSTMWSAQRAALEAAWAAFRYERGILSGDMSKVLEDGRAHAIPRWAGGHFIRIFPRLVGATDEYMSQILYRSYAASESYLQMFEHYKGEKLSDKAAHEMAQKTIRTYLDRAFEKAPVQDTIDALYQLGVQRGLKGPKLEEWIKTEMDKNGHLFQTPNYRSGLNFAKDMLFQRQFSKDNMASRIASQYESTVNNFPIMRLFGQLFFRTPVRVFEESLRLTPGLNLVTPNFVRDLAGRGPGGLGAPAHLRAQGEAMLSIGLGASIMMMYARGQITGGGMDDNWRQKKSLQNGGYEPYTIYFGDPNNKDTYKFNFRNYDPFAGPLKIIANAMDSFNLLQTRVAQGEYVGDDEALVLAHVTAGVHAIVTAFKDASLTQGFTELAQLKQDLSDPEVGYDGLLKWFAKKASMLVPSTATKVQSLDSESKLDPATLSQMMLSKLAPNTQGLPKQYDALGNANTDPNPMAQLTGIDLRQGGKSDPTVTPKQKFIGEKLNEITVLTGKHWVPPYDAGSWAPSGLQGYKGTDLRTIQTKSGETYWDRLNRDLKRSGLEDQLYAMLHSRLTVGVPSVPESQMMGNQVQQLINNARQAAFIRLMSEEHGIGQQHIDAVKDSVQAIRGQRDVHIAPYK